MTAAVLPPCGDSGSCPLRGAANGCPLADTGLHRGTCWCAWVEMPAELIEAVPEAQRGRACICHRCVAAFRRTRQWRPEAGPGDVYLDDRGRMVFTAGYHLRRGYCCGNGCRHCPYDEDGVPRPGAAAAAAGKDPGPA